MNMSKFLELYETVMESVNLTTIRPQTIVVIDPKALEQDVIVNDIIKLFSQCFGRYK